MPKQPTKKRKTMGAPYGSASGKRYSAQPRTGQTFNYVPRVPGNPMALTERKYFDTELNNKTLSLHDALPICFPVTIAFPNFLTFQIPGKLQFQEIAVFIIPYIMGQPPWVQCLKTAHIFFIPVDLIPGV